MFFIMQNSRSLKDMALYPRQNSTSSFQIPAYILSLLSAILH